MAEDTPGQITLTPEQQTHVDGLVKQARETAVTEFKTTSEAERAKQIPETYDFKFADNSPLDSKTDAEKIASIAKKHGLTAGQATEFFKHTEELAGGVLQRQKQFLTDQIAKWVTDTESDKDLGGANLQTTLLNTKRVMDKFAPAGSPFQKLLDESGYGNHPEWVRFVNAIGKAMAEDGYVPGTSFVKPKKKEDWEIAYATEKN